MKSLKNLADYDLTVAQQVKVLGKGYCGNGAEPHVTQDSSGSVVIRCDL